MVPPRLLICFDGVDDPRLGTEGVLGQRRQDFSARRRHEAQFDEASATLFVQLRPIRVFATRRDALEIPLAVGIAVREGVNPPEAEGLLHHVEVRDDAVVRPAYAMDKDLLLRGGVSREPLS